MTTENEQVDQYNLLKQLASINNHTTMDSL